MATESRLAFTPNLVVGLSIMLLGVVLMLDRLGVDVMTVLRLWPILLILFGASVVFQALSGGAGAAERDRPIVSPGLVVVLVVGFLFVTQAQRRSADGPRDTDAPTSSLFAVMARDYRQNHSPDFRGAEMTSIMGRTELDLRQAVINPDEPAVIDVFGLMGSVVIRVPEGWQVDLQSVHVLGGSSDARPAAGPAERPAEPAGPAPADALERDEGAGATGATPRVIVRGFMMLGGVAVRS